MGFKTWLLWRRITEDIVGQRCPLNAHDQTSAQISSSAAMRLPSAGCTYRSPRANCSLQLAASFPSAMAFSFHCRVYVAVVIEKVSVRSLSKMGLLPIGAGDFRDILAEVVRLQRPNTRAIMHEIPYFKVIS